MPTDRSGRTRRSQQLRDFIWTLIRTDFKSRYHGHASGFLWALFKPVMMFLVLFSVFSFLFKNSTYVFNLLIGLLLWDFFSESTRAGVYSLSSKAFLLTKAVFPRWVLTVTSSVNALITLLVWTVTILTVITISRGLPPLWALGLFFLYLVQFYAIVTGFALGASVLYLKFRDFDQVWDVVLQAGFFLAPIFYPLSILPERLHFYLYAWPVTPVLQFSRMVLVERQAPTLKAHLFLLAMTVTILGAGILLFRRNAPKLVEKL